jgi:hypothetical protein
MMPRRQQLGHSAGEGRNVFSAQMEAFLRSIARVGLDR